MHKRLFSLTFAAGLLAFTVVHVHALFRELIPPHLMFALTLAFGASAAACFVAMLLSKDRIRLPDTDRRSAVLLKAVLCAFVVGTLSVDVACPVLSIGLHGLARAAVICAIAILCWFVF